MSRLDDLPPDQRATLSLLLRRRKAYAEVAALLGIPERAVHDRAHAALAVLAARRARELPAERREEVGDYLLGQRSGIAERLATRKYLEGSAPARGWADALAGELAPLAADALPEIPRGAERPAAASSAEREPPPRAAAGATALRARRSPPRSRLGGALLLGVIVAVAILAIVLIASGGGGSGKRQAGAGSSSVAGGQTAGSSTRAGATSTQGAKAKEDKRIALGSPDPSSKAVGVAEVLSEGKQYAFYLAAEHLEPSKGKGFFYAVWLYNSPASHEALSRSPEVGANGSLQGGALLPSDAGKYHTMLLTRERSPRPTSPGPVVLRGGFALR